MRAVSSGSYEEIMLPLIIGVNFFFLPASKAKGGTCAAALSFRN
jgi:hypothetical protein